MDNSVEGQDYIFDRYAFLSVAPDADGETIRQAIKAKKAGLHPDRMINADDELQRNATQLWEHTEQCELLLDPQKRAIFDERLEFFKEHYPSLVSTTGMPLITLDDVRLRIDLSSLTTGEPVMIGAEQSALDALAKAPSPIMMKTMKLAYENNPDDAEVKEAYQQLLRQALAYTINEERLAWKQAGITGEIINTRQLADVSDYRDFVKESIEEVKATHIPNAVKQYALLQGAGLDVPLLLPENSNLSQDSAQGNALAVLSEEDQQRLASQAAHVFNTRTHRLDKLANKRQELMEALLETANRYSLNAVPSENGMTEIVVLSKQSEGEAKVLCSIMFMENDYDVQVAGIKTDHAGKTLKELQAETFDHETYVVESELELKNELIAQAFHCYNAFKGAATEQAKQRQFG